MEPDETIVPSTVEPQEDTPPPRLEQRYVLLGIEPEAEPTKIVAQGLALMVFRCWETAAGSIQTNDAGLQQRVLLLPKPSGRSTPITVLVAPTLERLHKDVAAHTADWLLWGSEEMARFIHIPWGMFK